jgi:hypothetical protein
LRLARTTTGTRTRDEEDEETMMELALIPQPKSVRQNQGTCELPWRGTIGIGDQSLFPVADAARCLFRSAAIHVAVPKVQDDLTITLGEEPEPHGYHLRIRAAGIELVARDVTAAFHGLQTLRQIADQAPGRAFPRLTIKDWPDVPERGVYYDVCRGRVPELEQLMTLADELAHYKINHLELYVEHTFAFRQHPKIGKRASPLTAEDILQLDAYCRERHVELVPSLASFGHMAKILSLPEYRHLAEDKGKGEYAVPREEIHGNPPQAWTLSPAVPAIYEFLDELYSEFLPLFSSARFNVCCDETWDLGLGQSKQLCEKKGKGRVYLDHILKLRELAGRYGKKLMFWGDIIRDYPELIEEIPEDVTVLDWAYRHKLDFDRLEDFREVGVPFFACPGTNSWNSLFPRLGVARANISGWSTAADKYGAQGLLNTDWGDGGHYNFMEYSWPGYLFGAEQGWNRGAKQKDFLGRFAKLFLGSDAEQLPEALERFGDISSLMVNCGNSSTWMHIFWALPDAPVFGWEEPMPGAWSEGLDMKEGDLRLDAALARRVLQDLDWIREVFQRESTRRGVDPEGVLPYWVFAVDTTIHAARKLEAFGPGGEDTPERRRALKRELKSLRRRFEKLWEARNRRSEIRVTLKRYDRVLKAL